MKPTSAIIAYNAKFDQHIVAIYRGPVCRFYNVTKSTIGRLARTLRLRKAVFCGEHTDDDLTIEWVTL